MSYYGIKWRINGHRVGYCHRFGDVYHVVFERCFEENALESVENIDWTNVEVKEVRPGEDACILPVGYTFAVQDWGDVTPYQAQIAELAAASEAKDNELSEKNALIAEKEQQIAQKDSKIAEMADAEQAAKILLGEAE